MKKYWVYGFCFLSLIGCGDAPLNNPYSDENSSDKVFYTSFLSAPKTLDPARAFSGNELEFISQILEPPLQYHYLKRPYQLVPLAAISMPTVAYYNQQHQRIRGRGNEKIAYSLFTIHLKPHRFYQPHPAFAKAQSGQYRYLTLPKDYLTSHRIRRLQDFPETGTRELVAEDYVYQIKRLAMPNVHSPILGMMSQRIEGLADFTKRLAAAYAKHDPKQFFDLRRYSFSGVKALDRYTYQIKVNGQYPQFVYWLAMTFFAPTPWEVDQFYAQAGMAARNLTFDWMPVGTGPYYLTENDPNRQMVLMKNPNFSGEYYPTSGEPGDATLGLLQAAGKPLPFVNKVIFSLEKEAIPRWNKFLQGYYDTSGISSDSFDEAIHIGPDGQAELSAKLRAKKLRLSTQASASVYYTGFNMLDPIVGGKTERARRLRQAITLAIDMDEYISIFLNGRGTRAYGPIPPGIPGFQAAPDENKAVVSRQSQSSKLKQAIELLRQADYVNGRDRKTGKPLILNLDVAASNGPGARAILNWWRKQFRKLKIQLNIRATQYNRFQEKIRHGHVQLFGFGWAADYPDPENFLALLYSKNGKVKYHGENASNYSNPHFDRLFQQMKFMPNGPEREKLIQQMVHILRHDAPWVWGYYPIAYQLTHVWMGPIKAKDMGGNTLKYLSLDTKQRQKLRAQWNQANGWPLLIGLSLLVLFLLPILLQYRRRLYQPRPRLPS